MACILLNSITLAMERPAITDVERDIVDGFGWIFTVVFLIEFIMKIVAWNFMFGPTNVVSEANYDSTLHEGFVVRKFNSPARYWDEGWNKLDGTLVIISVIDVVLTNIPGLDAGSIAGLLKIFRILRALRPLRAVNKLPGLKLVVNCLLASLAPIGTTLIIVFTI